MPAMGGKWALGLMGSLAGNSLGRMSINTIVSCVVAIIAIGTAHTAGAGYVLASQSGASDKWSIVRTVISIALVLLAIRLTP